MLRRRDERGFTLIELLIVIAIIGILAAVAIPNFMSARDRARFSAAVSSVDAIRTALEMYMVDWNTYPEAGINLMDRLRGISPAGAPSYYTGSDPTGVTFTNLVWTPGAADPATGLINTYTFTVDAMDRRSVTIQATETNVFNEDQAGAFTITPPRYPW